MNWATRALELLSDISLAHKAVVMLEKPILIRIAATIYCGPR
ncbi:hypothetical protein A2U01_0097001, partial [Trifolium medium]|nr:hypothetical protein [Trifolium medium]